MTLAPGSTFGPYQILDPLGRGGMATVYKAYEPGLDRYVALKILPSEFLHDEGFAERFRREAKVIARLEHPNIIPIHNFGIEEQSRTPWMAMRMIGGGALSGYMKKARLGAERTVSILRGVAEALDYAHGKGVIHRDIKPQNILLDEAERVYLADFGIAKMVEGSSGLTATGMISGTPQYMAPEQAMAGTVDHRADIYALGIVAYEMLTGRVPFAADTPVAVLMKHVQEPIPIASVRDVPEPLMRALLKALAKNPEDRWPTAGSFVKALSEGLTEAPRSVEATPTGFLPTEPNVPRPGGTPARGTAANQRAATWAGATTAGTPRAGTPYPGTPAAGTAYPQAVGGAYPGTPAGGTPYPPQAPTYPPGAYPTVPPYPNAPPQYPTGGYPAAYPPPAPTGGPGRGLVLGLVAAVALAGILGTAILFIVLRPSRAPEATDRPPVTTRPAAPPAADAGSVTTNPMTPVETVAAAPTPSIAPPVTLAPRPSAIATPPTRRASAATPAAVAEGAAPVAVAPPTLPAIPEPARSVAPSFPGAGKVDFGQKFFEKTLTYAVGEPLAFDAHVGAVKVPTVQMVVGENKRKFGRKDEQHREVRALFPVVDCPKGAGEWDYKMTVALLDDVGRELHRFADSGSCKNEIKSTAAYDAVPNAIIPAIRGLRVRLEASKD